MTSCCSVHARLRIDAIMKVAYIFILGLCASFVSGEDGFPPKTTSPSTPSTSPKPDPNRWDTYVLTQIWPGGFCKSLESNETCNAPSNDKRTWTVHGLWPTLAGTLGPNNCGTTPLDLNNIQSITDKLKAIWPSLDSSVKNQDFWSHEWLKHGTCISNNASSQLAYFQQTLEMVDNYNMALIMKVAGFIPSSKPYNKTDIMSKLTNTLGKKPSLLCLDSKDESVLSQVSICFSKEDYSTMVDCQDSKLCNNTEILYGLYPGENSASLLTHSLFTFLATLFVLLRC